MKINQVLILPIFLLMFILSSCILSSSNTKFYHYDYFEGIYYCDSIDSELYSKGKVEIKEINKNTFIRNNGKNCVEDKKNIDNYYLFELYCYSDSLAQFVKLELSEIKGSISAQGRYGYYGNINSSEFNIKDERFEIRFYHGDDFYIKSKNNTLNEKLYYQ